MVAGSARARDAERGPRLHVSLPTEPTAPRIGRRSVQVIESFADSAVVDDVKLLVSELVTNSVKHATVPGGGRIDLVVEVLEDSVLVSVRDPGMGFEHRPRDRRNRRSGWGLYLVDEISDRWGIERVADGGTTVWFEMGRHSAAASAG